MHNVYILKTAYYERLNLKMEPIGDTTQGQRLINFRIFYLITQMVGITIIILMAAWISIYLGGFGWSAPAIEFNWHPLLMTIGMIYLFGNSITLYRSFRYARKKNLKISHATLFGVIMVLIILALIAVFNSHNLASPPIPNLYSLHSWIGLGAVIIFGCQWVAGFVSFLYPQIAGPNKMVYMPIHIYFGLLAFVLAIIAALLGITEKAIFHMGASAYSQLPNEAYIVNSIGALIVLFAGLIVFLTTNEGYRRIPLPEDAMLLIGHDDERHNLLSDASSSS
ncbi:Plasma membrane ascorbate-dependent reductase CYBRD1 [Pseudolycoriella hygida]|uniref:Plasma membrane ascorbate-dependent reductase CYBRD1 n=1 Tax=Pseudolycoriella hygida TaxID=35572 RepID=A0A9Q0N4G6_9DIPT|nr:Plasma membrane ascorbate-dependent reductase CYBRD1 [Pseudolycoriella hygida]